MIIIIIGEFLVCEREPTNAADRYAVAIRKSGTIVGYLSRKVVKVYSEERRKYSLCGYRSMKILKQICHKEV